MKNGENKPLGRVGVAALVGVAWVCWAATVSAQQLDAAAEPLWNYSVPEDFSLESAQMKGTAEGGTILASTVGRMAEATCTVVVVSEGKDGSWTGKAYPYQHSPKGTACMGVESHPDGGFFVRGKRAGAMSGEVAGFTARVDAKGNEKWLIHDTEVAEGQDFRGSYLRPHGAMTYSPRFEYLMTITIGEFSIGMSDKKKVTHVSVLKNGELRVPAKTIGDGGGFGVIGGLETRMSDGYFLLYLYSFGSQGANFYAYNGRESVDRFSPLDEDWSQRFVRALRYGPNERVHLLWLKRKSNNPATRLAVVDDEDGSEVWTGQYPATAEMNGSEVLLGLPRALYVGADHVMIRYAGGGTQYGRVLDAEDGTELGVVDLGALTEHAPVGVVGGPDGGLKLVAHAEGEAKIYEYALKFGDDVGEGGGGGDAGFVDGGVDDFDDDDSGGCSAVGTEGPVGALAWLIVMTGVVGWRRRGG